MFENVFIIAEAGVNHNGNEKLAFKLIDAAAETGAAAVKFQNFITEELVTKDAPKAKHHLDNLEEKVSHFEMLKSLELSQETIAGLKKYCEKKGILFMCTPYDIKSTEFLLSMNLPVYKVASSEFTNYQMLDLLRNQPNHIILSCGMSSMEEVEDIIDFVSEKNKNISLCQCTTNYPVDFKNINLNVIKTFIANFPEIKIGFSDHSKGIEASVAAVALGAVIIEKHLTLDRNLPGPDHRGSLEPLEFKSLVNSIRNVELALGSGKKEILDCENQTRAAMKKSAFAARDIKKGEILKMSDLKFLRPGSGIDYKMILTLLGKKFIKDVLADERIKIEILES